MNRRDENDVQCGCLTYKYSLIAVILVPIICTLSMSLLVSLASTVPTTVNNRFRFSHDVLRCRSSASYSRIAKLLSNNVPPWQHDRLSDRRNMDREQFVVLVFFLAILHTLGFNTLTTTVYCKFQKIITSSHNSRLFYLSHDKVF